MLKTQTSFPQQTAQNVRSLLHYKDRELLNELMEMKWLPAFVQNLPPDDFFRIIKRIGEEDALPVLAEGTADQWQYVLDLEVWDRDILNTDKLMIWFDRLTQADASKLVQWISSEQWGLAAMLLIRKAEVVFREEEGQWELPQGFFSIDGHFYVKALNQNDTPVLERFLRALADHDFEAYQELLWDLASQMPSETEEELYRQRSGRLVEYGFAPHEEALAVYAPLGAEALLTDPRPLAPGALVLPDERALIPAAPLAGMEGFRLLTEAMHRISDPLTADRVRLEFTSLCNMLIAADSFDCVEDYDHLSGIGRQAAGYLHLALQKHCGQDVSAAADLLGDHSLTTIFRVGYGFAVELKQRVKRLLERSRFSKRGRQADFWGSPWAETVEGLLLPHPMYHDFNAPSPPYRTFESVDDLTRTETLLNQLEALDRMLARLTQMSPAAAVSCLTFHPLLFIRWARHLLNLEPSFAPLSAAQARKFFRILRRGEISAPYRMEAHRDIFIDEFLKGAAGFEPQTLSSLSEALAEIWEAFCREFENVETKNFDARFSKFLLIDGKKSARVHPAKVRLDL